MANTIKLQTDSLLHVPFDKYNKDFTFIVNSERFETSSFFADLLSPKISSLHLIDPTINEFKIDTKSRGDFNKIIKLNNFEESKIEPSEFEFIFEVFEQICTEKVEIHIAQRKEEITSDNVIDLIKQHQDSSHQFKSLLSDEIEYVSAHFTDLKEKFLKSVREEESERGIHETVIEQIISQENLQLESESELLDFVVDLYMKDRKFSPLFEFVIFENVDVESMNKFVKSFDVNDLTTSTWLSLVSRLQQPISQERVSDEGSSSEYRKKERKYKKKYFVDIETLENEFNGVMNYLQTHSNIKDEINITYSSYNSGDPYNLLQYENKQNYFETDNQPNSWICFEFKTHQIIPSSYIIRSFYVENHEHLKSWKIEGSKDNENWTPLDEQTNNSFLNGGNRVHLFPIQNVKNLQSFKYLRIQQTGQNWDNDHYLLMNSIEFYGKLI